MNKKSTNKLHSMSKYCINATRLSIIDNNVMSKDFIVKYFDSKCLSTIGCGTQLAAPATATDDGGDNGDNGDDGDDGSTPPA